MEHVCGQECKCNIDAAVAALEESSRLLRASVMSDSMDLMTNAYALVRAAKVRVQGAMADYREHVAEASGLAKG